MIDLRKNKTNNMKFTINVGLLNNPLTAKETVEYLSDRSGYSVIKYKVDSGSYHELIEPTVVMQYETAFTRLSKIIEDTENLCSVLNQECIAIKSDSFELLVYNISYCGTHDKFDEEYFLTI